MKFYIDLCHIGVVIVVLLISCQDSSSATLADEQGLTVDQTSIEVVIPPNSLKAIFKFVLRNNTNKKVYINKLTPSCECVFIERSPTHLLPDSSGELIASIIFGDRFGSIEQKIAVTYDTDNILFLSLTARRPLKMTSDPEFIQGRLDEITSQSVMFIPASGLEVAKAEISFNGVFIANAVSVRNGSLEVPLAQISLSSFRPTNFLKIICTFSDESVFERAVPIYVIDY